MKKPIGRDPQIEAAAEKLITLAEAAEIGGYSHAHVRLLVSERIVWGIKIGQYWLTTREAIEEYSKIEQPLGRPKGSTKKST